MKKIILILLMILSLISLSACGSSEIVKPEAGLELDKVTLNLKHGLQVEVDSSIDPGLLIDIISKNYNSDVAYQFSAKINQINDEVYNQEVNGYYYYNMLTKVDYLKANKNSLGLEVFFYNEGISEMLYLVKSNGSPLYGAKSSNGKISSFKNGDEIVPVIYPSASGITDKKTEANCNYLVNVDRVRRNISFGALSGLYNLEYINEFKYEISVTEKYIILTVNQPYGETISNSYGIDPALLRKGECVKTIYLNVSTLEIDYIEANIKTYTYPSYMNLLYDYSYVLSKIEKSVIDDSIDDLMAYTKANTVSK